MKTNWMRWAGLACLGTGLSLSMALSATAQAQVTCDTGSFSGNSLNFGQAPLEQAAIEGVSTFTLNCTNASSAPRKLRVCLGLGAGTGGSMGEARQMKHTASSASLNYQLYTTQARTEVFENWPSNKGAVFVSLPANASTPVNIPVYGRILGGQNTLPTGAYGSEFLGGDVSLRWESYEEQSLATDCALLSQARASNGLAVRFMAKPYCTLAIDSHINFGAVSSLANAVTATGSLSARCSSGTPYKIRMANGLHASGSQRRMQHANQSGQYIAYDLYRATGTSQPWGSDAATQLLGTGTGSETPHSIYARVPPQAVPAAGQYQDTVVVQLEY